MAGETIKQKFAATAKALTRAAGTSPFPDTVVVLGSGFKGFESRLKDATTTSMTEIPHFPVPKVEGHGGALVVGKLQGKPLAVLTGRVHLYEGHDAQDVVYPIRALAAHGVKRVLLTNAAGSVDDRLRPGQVMLVRDQINLTGTSCLIGAAGRELGPLFLDMGAAYDEAWRMAIRGASSVAEGVYAGVLGPAYETPAEARMIGGLGANVVGMSTVQETLAARHMGVRVACFSFVTNMAGGLGSPLSHGEVLGLVDKHRKELHDLLARAVEVAPS